MSMPDDLDALVRAVTPVDEDARAAAVERSAGQAKPAGSLGQLEAVAAQLAAIAGACPPPAIRSPHLVIAAGDHGVHAQGVTPWPQDITAMMVATFCAGGAAANAIAATVGAEVTVLDVGVAGAVPTHPRLRAAKVRRGTRDLTVEDAMTDVELTAAVRSGADLARELVEGGTDLVVLGDMGIANTTASAALIAAFTGASAAKVTGRGTGIDDEMLVRKRAVVEEAVARATGRPPWAMLAALGGLEHAALVGVMLAAASARVPVVLDGVISDAAAVAAVALCPRLRDHLIAGHRSVEPGASVALRELRLSPLVDLGLRLGEGTGALLAVPVIRAAAATLRDVVLLSELGPA